MTKNELLKICKYINGIISATKWENHVYVVGGAVRDMIMGNQIKDIDIVIDLKNGGVEFSLWLYENSYLTHDPIIYHTYGTSMFVLKEFPDIEIEAVHTRKEQYKDPNSRNPEQEFGTIKEDSFRRDLTINSLYYNVSSGEYYDPTKKGKSDIRKGVLRVTNKNADIVFQEDPLRILRVIRFQSRYNFHIIQDTYKAMKRNVDRLEIISKERIADELNKMLMTNHPTNAITNIYAIGAMKYVIPELEITYPMLQNKYHKGSVFYHTMMALDFLSKHDTNNKKLTIRMAVLLHDIGKINTKTIDDNGNVHFYGHELESEKLCSIILKRLKYSNDFIDEVAFLCKYHMRTKNWGNEVLTVKDKSLRKLQYECKTFERFYDLIQLIDADNNSHSEGYCLDENAPSILHKTYEMMHNKSDMFGYKLPVDGYDVMTINGIKPGKEVKKVLEYMLKIAYSRPKITRKECLRHIKGYNTKTEKVIKVR